MKAGKLDNQIELFEPGEPIDDGYTTLPGPWDMRGKRWAQYMPGTVREVFEASGREGLLPAVFLVRKDSVTTQVTEIWKLVHDGITYDVQGAVKSGRDGVRITAIGTDEDRPSES